MARSVKNSLIHFRYQAHRGDIYGEELTYLFPNQEFEDLEEVKKNLIEILGMTGELDPKYLKIEKITRLTKEEINEYGKQH